MYDINRQESHTYVHAHRYMYARTHTRTFNHCCVLTHSPQSRMIPACSKRLVTEPLQSLYQTLKSTVRSALFLSIYCGNAWFAVCLLRKLNMLSPAALYVTVGILAGMYICGCGCACVFT